MRSILTTVVQLAGVLTAQAFAMPVPHEQSEVVQISLFEYNIETAYTRFSLPAIPSSSGEVPVVHDADVVFSIKVNPTPDSLSSDIVFNGRPLALRWDGTTNSTRSPPRYAIASDLQRFEHIVEYDVNGVLSGDNEQAVLFHIKSVDSKNVTGVHFVLVSTPTADVRLRKLWDFRDAGSLVDFAEITESFSVNTPVVGGVDDGMSNTAEEATFDFAEEIEALSLLEAEAETLRLQIATKKQAIAYHLREHRNHVSLNDLIQECDGLVCVAKVIGQRICDKITAATERSHGYANLDSQHLQYLISFSDESQKPQQTSRNCTKSKMMSKVSNVVATDHNNSKAANMPNFRTKNSTSVGQSPPFLDLVNPPNPLVQALQIIAGILGLALLFRFVRRRCMSIRKRVERAADREERRNARAYRRAARRAEMRRRWDDLLGALNCFRPRSEPRIEDYEEKRALILQDAFLEQLADLDQAEKGDVMEAEIRELRHAHEIVASLVRRDENRYDLITPVNDPPPPLVPLPFTPVEGRSRASTNTLPSYTSESLPDYSSQPETLEGSDNSVADGSQQYPSSISEDSSRISPPSNTSTSGRTRYTPTSSIADVSPRVSAETLRTRQSKETHDM